MMSLEFVEDENAADMHAREIQLLHVSFIYSLGCSSMLALE